MQTANHHVNLAPIYGILIAVVSIVFTIIFYFTNMSGALWTGYLGNLLMFLGVLFSVIHYNSQHHERTSAMALFAMGFRTTIWAVLIVTLLTIALHFISGAQREDNFWIYLFSNVFFTNGILGLLAAVLAAMVFKKDQTTTKPK